MGAVIETQGLTKFYGKTRGVEDVDLVVEQGEVFGFIGPNGAGKSTTIRILLNLIHPDSGTASVLGLDAHQDSLEIRKRVGYLPGELELFDSMSGHQMLGFLSALRKRKVGDDALGIADRLGLDLSRNVKDYSSGNRQKLAITQALMHRPDLLILDEPTNALDPLVQQEFHLLIDEVRSEGRTVFLSSHVLPEVERIADRVGIIRDGRIVAVESIEALKSKAVRRIEVRFADQLPPVDPFLEVESVRSSELSVDRRTAHLLVSGPMDAVVKKLSDFTVENLVSHDADLEESFLSYYDGTNPIFDAPQAGDGDEA